MSNPLTDNSAASMPPIVGISDRPYDEHWPRTLSYRAKRGELVRIRQGCYVDGPVWKALDRESKYMLRLRAVSKTARLRPVFGNESAGLIWGLPRPCLPSEVTVLVDRSSGRRSSNGVRRILYDFSGHLLREIDGHAVVGKIQTALDLSLIYEFPWAVAVMDRLLNKKPLPAERVASLVTKAEVRKHIERWPSKTKQRKALRVLEFANGLAMYPGESLSRVHMMQLGFPVPELQHRFVDADRRVIIPDFYWKEHGVVGEFDGDTKYMKPEYLQGRSPSQVVIEEKEREDRIRAMGNGVARWNWKTANSPVQLCSRLVQAGLPRDAPAPRRPSSTRPRRVSTSDER